ncbi:hypothetical protein T492DRAFT_1039451 [Pavlovales sp. CCMP2436]|nr:hypothetical protein T492DRAFT_1039451 [Pavlovales sp. CCMP2436]|mmetsp:Transcript_35161/g.81392  ORF Transcript_35161/g.81392 Transcript_35161/m.81392 type:complete len:290 (+) Transcript_35161:37-906(+)
MLSATALVCMAAVRPAGAAPRASIRMGSPNDLLIIGTGTLGTLAARQWLDAYPDARVVGETRSTKRHDELRAAGVEVRTKGSAQSDVFPNVLICFSPGVNLDFPAEVRGALEMWNGSGGCVFTSSGGVFAEDDGGVVSEDSPTSDSERSARMLAAERFVLEAGASVLRLAGLYTDERGAHNFWLSQEKVDQWGGGLINLLHYEDAASGSLAALKAKLGPRVLLLGDDVPLTRSQIVDAALKSSLYAGMKAPIFTKDSGAMGKRYDTALTRSLIDWEPKYPDFDAFMTRT